MLEDKIAPSMMCVDFGLLNETEKMFKENNIDLLHIDIMDGEFVPNYALGIDFAKELRKKCSIPLDFHLMIDNPDDKIEWFDFQPGEYVSIHYESTKHIHRILQKLKSKGCKVGVALNPVTPINVLEYLLDTIDFVLIMTVNPGFAGQQMIPLTLNKIKDLRTFLDTRDCEKIEIECDGNVSFENAIKMKKAGANIFVGGSSSVFSKDNCLSFNICKMRIILLGVK